nr:hypothetical protein [uncultured Hyphomonas sp.]
MVSIESRRQLVGRVAAALAERVGWTRDTDVAKKDLERIRRLVDLGEIPDQVYENALRALRDNDQLSDEIHKWAATEAKVYSELPREPLDASKFVDVGDAYKAELVAVPADAAQENMDDQIWHRIEGESLNELVRQINPVDGRLRVSVQSTHFHWCKLPWYDNVALLRLYDPGWSKKNLALHYLIMGQNLFRLNGASPPIHEVNAKAPLRLTEETAADYLRFFCLFVHGEDGPFYLLERLDDPFVADNTALQPFEEHIGPVRHKGVNEKGHFLMSGLVWYSNALFVTNFAVQPTGMVEMLDDEPVAADLPIRISFPLS